MEILENPTYFWSLVGIAVAIISVWLYRRAHYNTAENTLFDEMDEAYFEADPLLDHMPTTEQSTADDMPQHNTDGLVSQPTDELIKTNNLDETKPSDAITPSPKSMPAKKSRPKPELIIALLVLPNQEEGFLGTDIFTVLQDQDMSYGKMEIFHHYGVGEIKVKHSIFSVANILNPGTFNPKEMETFHSAGLAFFMQLPGAFGGRVAFELMLNTAKRVAESLEGTVTDDQQYILDQDMIEGLRDKITHYELEKAET